MATIGSDRGGGGVLQMPFEAYGVRLLVNTNSEEVYHRLPAILPPGAVACSPDQARHSLALDVNPDGTAGLRVNGTPFLGSLRLELALEVLESQLHANVALDAPDRVFVHAGVVAHGESAIVLPGRSFTGKTRLVAEFVRAGAVYYSDDYAVLDEQGLVHPYPKPLSLRGEDRRQVAHPVGRLGGAEGVGPSSVGMILISPYTPGADWRPSTLSAGEAVLAMLGNAVPARSRPAEALRSITRAVEGATALEGDRGEASVVVERVLHRVH